MGNSSNSASAQHVTLAVGADFTTVSNANYFPVKAVATKFSSTGAEVKRWTWSLPPGTKKHETSDYDICYNGAYYEASICTEQGDEFVKFKLLGGNTLFVPWVHATVEMEKRPQQVPAAKKQRTCEQEGPKLKNATVGGPLAEGGGVITAEIGGVSGGPLRPLGYAAGAAADVLAAGVLAASGSSRRCEQGDIDAASNDRLQSSSSSDPLAAAIARRRELRLCQDAFPFTNEVEKAGFHVVLSVDGLAAICLSDGNNIPKEKIEVRLVENDDEVKQMFGTVPSCTSCGARRSKVYRLTPEGVNFTKHVFCGLAVQSEANPGHEDSIRLLRKHDADVDGKWAALDSIFHQGWVFARMDHFCGVALDCCYPHASFELERLDPNVNLTVKLRCFANDAIGSSHWEGPLNVKLEKNTPHSMFADIDTVQSDVHGFMWLGQNATCVLGLPCAARPGQMLKVDLDDRTIIRRALPVPQAQEDNRLQTSFTSVCPGMILSKYRDFVDNRVPGWRMCELIDPRVSGSEWIQHWERQLHASQGVLVIFDDSYRAKCHGSGTTAVLREAQRIIRKMDNDPNFCVIVFDPGKDDQGCTALGWTLKFGVNAEMRVNTNDWRIFVRHRMALPVKWGLA